MYLNYCNGRFYAANIYLVKVKNSDSRKKGELCSKLTKKTPERHHGHGSGVVIVNFEHISPLLEFFYCWF